MPGKDIPDFDGGCWEMLNQDAVQILPPKPKFPDRPTTSCIKPKFKEKEKKGTKNSPVVERLSKVVRWEKPKIKSCRKLTYIFYTL